MNSKKTGRHYEAGLCQNLGELDAGKTAFAGSLHVTIFSLRQRYRKTNVPSCP